MPVKPIYPLNHAAESISAKSKWSLVRVPKELIQILYTRDHLLFVKPIYPLNHAAETQSAQWVWQCHFSVLFLSLLPLLYVGCVLASCLSQMCVPVVWTSSHQRWHTLFLSVIKKIISLYEHGICLWVTQASIRLWHEPDCLFVHFSATMFFLIVMVFIKGSKSGD